MAAEAGRALIRTTKPALWIDAYDAIAPGYGTGVLVNSIAALTDLRRLARPSVPGLGGAVRLIVGADRDLAARVITQARGGKGNLVSRARRAFAAGARNAAAQRVVSAARAYRRAWADAFSALTQLVAARATSVPSSTLAAAAEEALGSRKIGLAGPMIEHGQGPLTLAGKPELLFIGAEGCPFCAVQRWGMIVALSQFGTFSHLHLMQSDTTDRPVIRTFTFFGSRYQSPYISFAPVEALSNVRRGMRYAPLQRPSRSQNALLDRFDAPGQTPFLDVAGQFIRIDSTVHPGLLRGESWAQIASSLSRPSSIPAQAIAGEAEVLTAELCQATHGDPQSVCSAGVVTHYEAALPFLDGKGGGCPGTGATARSRSRHGPPPPARAARCRTG